MPTRTGGYPIGFRRMGKWQIDTRELAAWAKESGFSSIDLGVATEDDIRVLEQHGIATGTCDLMEMALLLSPDEEERKEAVAKNIEYIHRLAERKLHLLFTAMIPKDPSKSRADNYELAVASFSELAASAESAGSKIVIEGWPGMPPYYANPCCNPETYRRILSDTGGRGLGVNYDPSHLIRMGIDHIRFLEEFLPHVGHVHAKDTEILAEAMYEFGTTQTSAFDPPFFCGENYWRYTIPGHGQARWLRIFETLDSVRWEGIVSIELEDHTFHGSPEAEKEGLLCAKAFLETV